MTAGSMATAFSHVPLEDASSQIRLLTLTPHPKTDDPEQRIRCILTRHNLADAPEYIAISYAWGDADDPETVDLDGRPCVVRKNCWYVLRQAQIHGIASPVWIDALCINQQDECEKSTQVAMMGDIFRSAVQVNMCIGPHDDTSEHLFAQISEHGRVLGTPLDVNHPAFRLYNSNPLELPQAKEAAAYLRELGVLSWFQDLQLEVNALASSFRQLEERAYFLRLWIFQEVFLARKAVVVCGRSACSLADVHTFGNNLSHWLRSLEYNIREESKDLDAHLCVSSTPTIAFLGLKQNKVSLLHVGRTLCDLRCNDERDKIFSLLHVLDWGPATPIQPDYTLSTFDIALQILNGPYLDAFDDHGRIHEAVNLIWWLELRPNRCPIYEILAARRGERLQSISRRGTELQVPERELVLTADTVVSMTESESSGPALSTSLRRDSRPWSKAYHIIPRPKQYISLINEDEELGYLPACSRNGDLLVLFALRHRRTGFVLREEEDGSGFFRIMGQAIFHMNLYDEHTQYYLDRPDHPEDIGIALDSPPQRMKIHFNLSDFILWRCQFDLDWTPDSARTCQAELQLRFTTPVCDSRRPLSSYGSFETTLSDFYIGPPKLEPVEHSGTQFWHLPLSRENAPTYPTHGAV